MALLGGLALLVAGVFIFIDPVPQNPAYHRFADTREALGIPNFADVASNLVFLLAGIAGLWWTLKFRSDRARFADVREAWAAGVVFVSAVLLAFGSGWYHLAPAHESLVWDRLPIAVMAMAVVALVAMERLSLPWSWRAFPVLLIVGAASVFYWGWTEAGEAGDLRAYGLVQFGSLLAIPLLLALFPARYWGARFVVAAVLLVGISKIFEFYDWQAWRATGGLLSGHTLKHLAAALGVFSLALYVRERRVVKIEEK